MRTLILDLDHTVLNTTAFKTALANSLEISQTDWDRAYEQFVRDNGMFRPDDFLRGVTPAQRHAFETVLKTMRQFLFPDVLPFVRVAHEAGYRLVLLTFGDAHWQKKKVHALHLPKYIHTVFTEGHKVESLAEYVEHDTLVVDDKANELEAFHQLWPNMTLYWMKRANGHHRTTAPTVPHHTITSLNEIKL